MIGGQNHAVVAATLQGLFDIGCDETRSAWTSVLHHLCKMGFRLVALVPCVRHVTRRYIRVRQLFLLACEEELKTDVHLIVFLQKRGAIAQETFVKFRRVAEGWQSCASLQISIPHC